MSAALRSAGADDGAATDGLFRDHAGSTPHKDAVRHADVSGDIALGTERGPRPERGVMSDSTIEVHHGEVADLDVDGKDCPRADDDALAELHPGAEMGLWVDERQEFCPRGNQRGN